MFNRSHFSILNYQLIKTYVTNIHTHSLGRKITYGP